MPVGILQKPRGRTFPGSCRRNALWGSCKYIKQISAFAAGIKHNELRENPSLQCLRTPLPFNFQFHDAFLDFHQRKFRHGNTLIPGFAQSSQLGLLELALFYKGIDVGIAFRPCRFAAYFRLRHQLPVSLDFRFPHGFGFTGCATGFGKLLAMLNLGYGTVYRGYFTFFALKIPRGIKQVENRWHKIIKPGSLR